LKDHKKAERKAIELLSKTKLFKDFMRKNSMLASLFRLPGDQNDPLSQATWDAVAPITNTDTILARQFNDVKQTTAYFDGLGRLLQTVVKKGSLVTGDTARDFVAPVLRSVLFFEPVINIKIIGLLYLVCD
jgi:hypothetical protein